MPKKVLFIGLNDWMMRNLLKSTFVGSAKSADFEIFGLVYENSFEAYRQLAIDNLNMQTFPMALENLDNSADVSKSAKRNFAASSYLRKYKKKSNTLYYFNTGFNNSLKNKFKHKAYKFLARTFGFTNFDSKIYKNAIQEFKASALVQENCIPFLKEKEIDLIISCSPETPYDLHYMLAAEELGIKRISWIRSWDNITSKIGFMPHSDMVCVWSDLMEWEFRHFFPEYKDTLVEKIGSLQFDKHFDSKNIIPYDEFCKLTGLDPKKKFVLYTTGGPHICPDENLLIKQVDEIFSQNKKLSEEYELLIRLHPYAWNTSFDDSFTYDYAKMWPPKNKRKSFKGESTDILFSDYQIMISSFYHQSLNINIASTVTIDSCIYDKPVVNIGYDPIPVENKSKSIGRFYFHYDHYIPLVKSGGIDLVLDSDKLKSRIIYNLENPDDKADGRRKIVKLECGVVDGQAGKRLYQSIVKCLNK